MQEYWTRAIFPVFVFFAAFEGICMVRERRAIANTCSVLFWWDVLTVPLAVPLAGMFFHEEHKSSLGKHAELELDGMRIPLRTDDVLRHAQIEDPNRELPEGLFSARGALRAFQRRSLRETVLPTYKGFFEQPRTETLSLTVSCAGVLGPACPAMSAQRLRVAIIARIDPARFAAEETADILVHANVEPNEGGVRLLVRATSRREGAELCEGYAFAKSEAELDWASAVAILSSGCRR